MKRIERPACLGLTFILAVALLNQVVSAQAVASPKPDDVDAAIKKGIDYLESVEVGGSWDAIQEQYYNGQQNGGYSAAATYALLVAGVPAGDQHIVDAVNHLIQVGPQMDGIYSLGMRCQVWASLPNNPKYRPMILADANVLIDATKRNPVPGLYRYTISSNDWDLSASQYGVLGLWGCADRNLEVPTEIWQKIEKAWISKQYSDGSWGYQPTDRTDPGAGTFNGGNTTFTAAGIASLFITQQFLHGEDGLKCSGNVSNDAIEKGMDWLAKNAADLHRFPPYTLYAYERIGVASGYKYFGTYNWYSQGASILLHLQQPDGSFKGGGNEDLGYISDTALALLFLSRGRGPVVLNKLRYDLDNKGTPDKDSHWNQRPRDAANVTRWLGKELETDLNWQLVTLDAPIEELHDAPILYVAGNQPITLTADQEKKLRTFVEEGGMILGNSDCETIQFVDGFKKLGHRLFPDYEFEQLRKDAAIFNAPTKIKTFTDVWQLSNGIRPLMICLANDPASHWQTNATSSRPADFQLFENILLYVQDAKHLMYKGDSYIVTADASVAAAKTINVARLQYGGNWNPEPGGWRRLAAIVHNTRKTDLKIDSVKLGEGKLDNHYQVADLTGTVAFTLSDSGIAEMKKFIDGGGTVIFDAGGGSGAFGDSAKAAIAAMYPNSKLALLPSAHPVLQSEGKTIEAVYREAAKKIIHGKSVRLSGVEINGRTAIFFSGEDLSSALVGQPLSTVVGYDPETATTLMGNMLDYASGQPASAPTTHVAQ